MESAVMTSVVMSSQSAVGNQRMKRSARETTASWNQQRFALTLKIQQMLFALITSRKIPVASYSGSSRKLHCYCISSRHGIQTQEKQNRKMISRSAKIKTQRKNSAEAQSSSRHESAAKQLTIYESWMSTAELKFKWRKRQEACKRKGQKYYSLSVLSRTLLNGKNFVSNGINLNRGFIYFESAIEEEHCEFDVVRTQSCC
ncbi:hypothetical protein F511_44538 [Dorcoceras hygrometricum]|uniref:Uncharacterized protein n=1 Tax=Dorcoceras hygrometricum TaxID=472368 RepID=A0A2Z7CV76_9LAMI|nr:hypothetical protein F511_44538 [Dorcoceras hygrometricum]